MYGEDSYYLISPYRHLLQTTKREKQHVQYSCDYSRLIDKYAVRVKDLENQLEKYMSDRGDNLCVWQKGNRGSRLKLTKESGKHQKILSSKRRTVETYQWVPNQWYDRYWLVPRTRHCCQHFLLLGKAASKRSCSDTGTCLWSFWESPPQTGRGSHWHNTGTIPGTAYSVPWQSSYIRDHSWICNDTHHQWNRSTAAFQNASDSERVCMLGDISGLERIYIVRAYLNHKSIKTLEKKIASYPAYRECNRWHIDTWIAQGREPGRHHAAVWPDVDFHRGNRCSHLFLRRKYS